MEIDHADIVVTHLCNRRCPHCIDKFVTRKDNTVVSFADVRKFMEKLKAVTDKKLEVLLLGGEPTTAPLPHLIGICDIIKEFGYSPIMSTNGVLKDKIIRLLPHLDSVQITVEDRDSIEFWRPFSKKVNLKLNGDESLTIGGLELFCNLSKDFYRRSLSMFFTPEFEELCKDEKVWKLLNSLTWTRNGSYLYAWYKGVRIKRCITGETNIIDEPTVPKLYPNGNYNKTWQHENMDDYLNRIQA